MQCEFLATEGLIELLNTLKFVQNKLNTLHDIEGILITMFDKRLNHSRDIVRQLKQYFKNMVFKTVIKRNFSL